LHGDHLRGKLEKFRKFKEGEKSVGKGAVCRICEIILFKTVVSLYLTAFLYLLNCKIDGT